MTQTYQMSPELATVLNRRKTLAPNSKIHSKDMVQLVMNVLRINFVEFINGNVPISISHNYPIFLENKDDCYFQNNPIDVKIFAESAIYSSFMRLEDEFKMEVIYGLSQIVEEEFHKRDCYSFSFLSELEVWYSNFNKSSFNSYGEFTFLIVNLVLGEFEESHTLISKCKLHFLDKYLSKFDH